MSYVDPRIVLNRLSDRDLAIIDDIESFRLLTTRLLQRLHFPIGESTDDDEGTHASSSAAMKATMRVMTRLDGHNLVTRLDRRIGGVRHGSQGFIWQLTSTGANLQRHRRGEPSRRRYVEPSPMFTDHTLAVAGLAVTIRELARAERLEVLRLQTEPDCWREHIGPHGVIQKLKPDLHTVTATPEFEDHLFVEADLGTEHLPRILTKCRAYVAYHATGIEQRDNSVFPAVLWVTDTEARAAQLRQAIRSDPGLPNELFTVITADQFAAHLVGEPPPDAHAASPINSPPGKEELTHGIHP